MILASTASRSHLGASARRLVGEKASASAAPFSTVIPSWATLDPAALGETATPHAVKNLVGGEWIDASKHLIIPNPLKKSGPPIFTTPDTQIEELEPFVKSMTMCSKSGVHNPLRNVDRYLLYGEITRKAGAELLKPEVADFFTQSIIKSVPKHPEQAAGEVKVTAAFLNNFGGDNVRFLARSFGVPGDHYGQMSVGHRWPFGPVALITPFNFPLEIPVLQLMGALFMGNKPVLKPAEKVSHVMEQFIHLLHHCGLPKEDVDILNCQGPVAQELITSSPIRLTQFTGSSRVGEILLEATRGKVKVEDAGFDWKIIGPDVSDFDYVAWQCDQDAYASSGQKCSAQSIVFMHENWEKAGLMGRMKELAATRNMDDHTVGPTLTVSTKQVLDHVSRLLEIPGAKILFGGKEIENHEIPDEYGAIQPTAVFVPLKEMLKDEHYDSCVTELFAPFQVVTTYDDSSIDQVLEACERMSHHLTAAVVSNDVDFQTKVLANTVNGTTYAGIRARTTGAPQNHWFGPAGDPRGAGIGTKEAIQMVWSCHREIVNDNCVPAGWVQPKAR
uniref:Aldehyde dehydrogenase domain-containing protein n=1 Tax=Attheya septentrionalis TaxID=420275 RepID=A0A7S2XK85_9STRA|mmetsp:Transcript_16424/g.29871  ORF Transcript_16424/g.29871 Transcript_16424/m.29871 type:complete len:559 (+) Transcript_16424:119-1795(+)